ncbi:unnamed protein product [Clonostachys byssicola]|uniref:C2H2 type master regulator of conidiophore development brlA n=1 Tax=Clonostachys byssicola TaxID=160290 RepID=A0A9N9Y4Q2_9HYPO|nr:unnamed protein product [Clonostachys byssicola]
MALPSNFETYLESFKERLDSNDLEDFKNTTFDEMQRTILQIQSKQVSDRNNRGLARLEKFLNCLQRYGHVIQRLNQGNDILAYIWGPIKFLLKARFLFTNKTSTHNRAFDQLLIAYKEIGEGLPLLPDGDRIFHSQPHMKLILSDMYQNLLEFHSILLDYFKQPDWEGDFDQTWKRRRERFTRQINKIAQDKSLLESQASPQEPTEENVLLGDYSFMDYAVLFWLPHLEAGAISRSVSHDTHMIELQESLGVFIERHSNPNRSRLTLAPRHSHKLEFFKDAPFYDQLEQAVASTKKHLRQFVHQDKLVLDLFDIVIKVRNVLEQTWSNTTDDEVSIRHRIEEKYGKKESLFKCERFNCQYFTAGFSTSGTRDEHLKQHLRPFRCADLNCYGFVVGFVTANARDIHIRQVHSMENRADREFPTLEDVQRSIHDQSIRAQPVENVIALDAGEGLRADEAVEEVDASDPEDDRTRQRQKRPRQTGFNCPDCGKVFSKKYNMESHATSHGTERRYACRHCGKAFARESDLTRHETTHSGRREHVCRGVLRDGTRWGCGKAFARAETLRTHHKSTVGKLCIAPVLLQLQRDSDQLH